MLNNYIIIAVLVIFSGIFSGLTLGLMSLNPFALKRKMHLGDKYAAKIYPLRQNGNLLLCSLILANVAVNSALAVFLSSITSGVAAGFATTALIVIFGEITPQALFSRLALKLGARLSWLAYIAMFAFYPAAKPLSYILDKIMGEELPTIYSKREFYLLLKEHKKMKKLKQSHYEIIKGGLLFSEKSVKSIMTPWHKTFFLRHDDLLNMEKLSLIKRIGHSRIPVLIGGKNCVGGFVYVKDLATLSPSSNLPVSNVMRKDVHAVNENDKLDKVLELFKKRRVHLFIVKNLGGAVSGIVTLEDVLEEIVGEIMDEYDYVVEMKE